MSHERKLIASAPLAYARLKLDERDGPPSAMTLMASLLDASQPRKVTLRRASSLEPAPPFVFTVSTPPDFSSEALCEAATQFASGLSGEDLSRAIDHYMSKYNGGCLGSIVCAGVQLYLFARQFEGRESFVSMPIATHGTHRFGHVPFLNHQGYAEMDLSAFFVPLWNTVQLEAQRKARALASLPEEPARMLLAALAVLYANETALQGLGGMGLVAPWLGGLRAARLSTLGVASFDLATGQPTVSDAHGLPHWRELADFFQRWCLAPGLFKAVRDASPVSPARPASPPRERKRKAPCEDAALAAELNDYMAAVCEHIEARECYDFDIWILDAALYALKECGDGVPVHSLTAWRFALSRHAPRSGDCIGFTEKIGELSSVVLSFLSRRAAKAART